MNTLLASLPALPAALATDPPLPEPALSGQALLAQLHLRYEALVCLSDTATASVWRGRDLTSQEDCVVKAFTPSNQCAYRREAAVALGIKHPNVIACLDTFVLPDGHACLVYEYATQGSLADFSASVALHAHVVTQAASDILQALHTLHLLGYVHCDIKPANILVTRLPSSGALAFKLGDLGSCATLKEAQSGKHGIGSPAYCAPERLYNQFGYASDIYSVGVTVYELLTGHLPFIGEVEAVYRAHLTRLPALGEINNPRWREWLEQALHKQPGERFARAELALAALLPPADHPATQANPAPACAAAPAVTVVRLPNLAKTGQAATLGGTWHLNQQVKLAQPPASLSLLAQVQSVCLGSEQGLQLLYPDTALLARVTPARPPYAVHGDCAYYHSGGRLVQYDACSGSQRTLLDNLSQPLALAAGRSHVAFAEARRVVIQRSSDQSASCVIRHRHYAMETLLCLSDDAFAMTTGLANQELLVRSLDGDVRAHVVAPGPWLCLAATAQGFLAASASLDQPGVLHLHQIDNTGTRQRHAQAVASLVVAASAQGWFVLDEAGVLVAVDLNGTAQPIAADLSCVSALAASPDGRRCAVAHQRGGVHELGLWALRLDSSENKGMP